MKRKAYAMEWQLGAQRKQADELAIPYTKFFSMKDDSIFAGKVHYPATIHDMLEHRHYRLLENRGDKILQEFKGELGKSIVKQIEKEYIVFPDRLFSKAILISLILETRPLVNMESVDDLVKRSLKDSEFSKHQFSFLKRFFYSALVQRLEAKDEALAESIRGYMLNSKVFALVFSVLISDDAQAQYENGLRSGNPYSKSDEQEWLQRARGKGVALSLKQIAQMIERISPKLCHPDLVATISGAGGNVNGSFMGRMHDLMGILEKLGIMPLGDDRTASYVLARYSYMAASLKIAHGMDINEYSRFIKDPTITAMAVDPKRLLYKLQRHWLDDTSKVLFWQGLIDASKKDLFGEAKGRVGGDEEDARQFAGYVGQFLAFKFQGVRELGLFEKQGMYRKIIENGIYAIHEGDLKGLRREVHTLMMLSEEIFPRWAYVQKAHDWPVFGLFADCPQLALCALGYIKGNDAVTLTRRLGMGADDFRKNANDFRRAHQKLLDILHAEKPVLSGEMAETAAEFLGKLGEPGKNGSKAESTIAEVSEKLGFDSSPMITKDQRQQVHDCEFLEKKKDSSKSYIDPKGNELQIFTILYDEEPHKVVLQVTTAGKPKNPKHNTVKYVAHQIRSKSWLEKKN